MVRIAIVISAAVLVLWLLSSAVVGFAASLSVLSARVWQLAWWLQHFGFGVAFGFVLGLVCGWALLALVARAGPVR